MRGVLTTLLRRRLSRPGRFPWSARLLWGARPWGARHRERNLQLAAATTCAEVWGWPVLPGVTAGAEGCHCLRADCPTPGAHPHDPSLLAATTDPRMVRWWWRSRPDAPVLLATGARVSGVSLPAAAGARVLGYFDALRIRTGPVIATPTRYVFLVAPYTMQELAELLIAQEWVPTSLRYHGTGGYLVLPPSRIGTGVVGWARPPEPAPSVAAGSAVLPCAASGADGEAPWLPSVADLMSALVAASTATPDGARLAY